MVTTELVHTRQARIIKTSLPPEQLIDLNKVFHEIPDHPPITPAKKNIRGISRPITVVNFNPLFDFPHQK